MKLVLGAINNFKNPIPNFLQMAFGERKEMLRLQKLIVHADLKQQQLRACIFAGWFWKNCAKILFLGLLAQLVEQRTLNPLVACSIRAEPTKTNFLGNFFPRNHAFRKRGILCEPSKKLKNNWKRYHQTFCQNSDPLDSLSWIKWRFSYQGLIRIAARRIRSRNRSFKRMAYW